MRRACQAGRRHRTPTWKCVPVVSRKEGGLGSGNRRVRLSARSRACRVVACWCGCGCLVDAGGRPPGPPAQTRRQGGVLGRRAPGRVLRRVGLWTGLDWGLGSCQAAFWELEFVFWVSALQTLFIYLRTSVCWLAPRWPLRHASQYLRLLSCSAAGSGRQFLPPREGAGLVSQRRLQVWALWVVTQWMGDL